MTDSEMFLFIKQNKIWNGETAKGHELNWTTLIEGETAYLFFQESDGKKDWKDNLNFFPTWTKIYKAQESHLIAHRGFVEEYKSANDSVMQDFIKKILDNPDVKNFVISGWSNGAAMAILAAEDFNYRTGYRADVVTFGAPKVFLDKDSVETVKKSCRIIKEFCHKSDIVTKLPIGFKHVNEVDVGHFSLIKVFNPWTYHTHYEEYV